MSGKFVALSKTLLSFSLPRTGLRGLLYHAIAKLLLSLIKSYRSYINKSLEKSYRPR
jgi:hypothetical protein